MPMIMPMIEAYQGPHRKCLICRSGWAKRLALRPRGRRVAVCMECYERHCCLCCHRDLSQVDPVVRTFIELADAEHGPFCDLDCAERFADNYDPHEPPASKFDPERA